MNKVPVEVRMANGQMATKWLLPEGVQRKEQVTIMAGLFAPDLSELGWKIMRHVRFVHSYRCKEKIVCCLPGEEGLYPSATHFFKDYVNTLPDELRGDSTDPTSKRHIAPIVARASKLWPNAVIVETQAEGTLMPVRFAPRLGPSKLLGSVDVVLGARRRTHIPERNWEHWQWLVDVLCARGLQVGVAGLQDTSWNLDGVVNAWEHPGGPTAGCLELLDNCRLYVGTDTGVSHLAALMSVPIVLFSHPTIYLQHKMVDEIRAGTAGRFTDLGVRGWEDHSLLANTISKELDDA